MRRNVHVLTATLALCGAAAQPAHARVVRFETVSRTPIAFGYEKTVGKLTYADRPGTAANRRIVDLARAPRDAKGEVISGGDVVILAPVDRSKANGTAIIDHDPRPAIAERYAYRDAYLHAYDAATAGLVREGFVLAEDSPALHVRAEELWTQLAH